MPDLDTMLYRWICRANERCDDLDLPIGTVEDYLGALKQALGDQYLEQLLIRDAEPVHFLDDETNPLRKWLLSARVNSHIVQTLELAAYFREFRDDPSLPSKIEKLKRDAFWPVFFELAIAARVKRARNSTQQVRLNPEVPTSVGDFTIGGNGYSTPCECSRLGHSPQITDVPTLLESLCNRIGDGAKTISTPLCVKVRSSMPLTGDTYNRVLQLVRRNLADARRSKLPTAHEDETTSVSFEELKETSEQIPFRMIDGRVVDTLGTDWDSASRLCLVPAKDSEEIARRHELGERFHEHESLRLFIKFGRAISQSDQYSRLEAKLKKKLKQTKITAEHFGKIALIEVPFDLRIADPDRLKEVVRSAATHSRATLAVILAKRESSPRFRHHYSMSIAFNQTAAKIRPDTAELFERVAQNELRTDPILGSLYHRSWAEAQLRAETIAKTNPD
jgi:hypothetical protein